MAKIKVGTQFRIAKEGYAFPVGTLVHVGAPVDTTNQNEVLVYDVTNRSIKVKYKDLEEYAPTLEELRTELTLLADRAAEVRSEITYMEDTGVKVFVQRDYNVWRTFDIFDTDYSTGIATELEEIYYGDS